MIIWCFGILMQFFARIGRAGVFVFDTAVRLTPAGGIAGRVPAAIMRSELMIQMAEIGARSVPVVGITGAFVGMTLAVQSYSQFNAFGIADRLGIMINISVVRELGPVLTALMLAGRVGGALTAELGTMKVTGQIDALRVMGADAIGFLVIPRFLACLLLAPILTLYADVLGVWGGYLVSCVYFDVNADAYWRYTAQSLQRWDLLTGLIKAFCFGGTLALISCYQAFRCRGGARGVGQACTAAFVRSFLAILILNFLLSLFLKNLYDAIWGARLLSL